MDKKQKDNNLDQVKRADELGAFHMPEKTKPTHRYFCEGCTGIAFYHVEGQPLPKQAKCQNCGKLITFVRPADLIKL